MLKCHCIRVVCFLWYTASAYDMTMSVMEQKRSRITLWRRLLTTRRSLGRGRSAAATRSPNSSSRYLPLRSRIYGDLLKPGQPIYMRWSDVIELTIKPPRHAGGTLNVGRKWVEVRTLKMITPRLLADGVYHTQQFASSRRHTAAA